MSFPGLLFVCILILALFVAFGLLSSHSLAEYLVRRGMLPRSILQLTPMFVTAARCLAALLVLLGLGRAAAVAGLISAAWMERYGLAVLLVLAGLILFWMTFRHRPPQV